MSRRPTFPDEPSSTSPRPRRHRQLRRRAARDGDEITSPTRSGCRATPCSPGWVSSSATRRWSTRPSGSGSTGRPPYELPVASVIPATELDVPATAQSAIGSVTSGPRRCRWRWSPRAIANGGQLLRPTWSRGPRPRRRASAARHRRWTEPPGDGRPVSPRTAQQLRAMMIDAVESGTGTGRPDRRGRGRRQDRHRPDRRDPVAWFVGFAGDEVAVAVCCPTPATDATGGADRRARSPARCWRRARRRGMSRW
jgi:hypothetical protein